LHAAFIDSGSHSQVEFHHVIEVELVQSCVNDPHHVYY
jgi:hypothetical protein